MYGHETLSNRFGRFVSLIQGLVRPVRINELNKHEWAEVIMKVIASCKPLIKYLPEMKPAREHINPDRWHDGKSLHHADLNVVEPKDFNLRLKCVELLHNTFNQEGEIGRTLFGLSYGVRFLEENQFLLADNGNLYLLHGRYERVLKNDQGVYAKCPLIEEYTVFCRFILLKDADQLAEKINLMNAQHDFFRRMGCLFTRGIQERSRRLQAMEDRFRNVKNIRQHLEWRELAHPHPFPETREARTALASWARKKFTAYKAAALAAQREHEETRKAQLEDREAYLKSSDAWRSFYRAWDLFESMSMLPEEWGKSPYHDSIWVVPS